MPIKTIILIASLLMMIGVLPTLKLSKRWGFYPIMVCFGLIAGFAAALSFNVIQLS
ncbi:MAG: hypothetical protein CK424_03855 [Legionella sp.]|nr:MAG: hypothetical protein CK424_03855 [Legionella sp.]